MITWIIRKLFLVKEIVSRTGAVHFQRYLLLRTPWFQIFLHKICESDRDKHMHDHPFNFTSFILKGSYSERSAVGPFWGRVSTRIVKFGSVVRHEHTDVHTIKLLTPKVWSLVVAGPHVYEWGYQTELGWLDKDRYRAWKRSNVNMDQLW